MDPRQQCEQLLQLARQGDRAALGALLDGFRPYLTLLAQRRFDPRLQSRVDPSDVVQLTFLEAQRDLPAFRGGSPEQLASWLRTMLERNVLRAAQQHLDAQRRSLRREQMLPDNGADGQLALEGAVASDHSSPSQRVMRGEEAILLAAALCELPEDQREAVRLRHLEGWTMQQLTERFQRSPTAVAGLIKRGLRQLRGRLGAE